MIDPTDPRAKAEASLRLAELAKTPRAKQLFRQLAAEYEIRAVEPFARVDGAPSIVPAPVAAPVVAVEAAPTIAPVTADTPMAETQQWLANLAAVRGES